MIEYDDDAAAGIAHTQTPPYSTLRHVHQTGEWVSAVNVLSLAQFLFRLSLCRSLAFRHHRSHQQQ